MGARKRPAASKRSLQGSQAETSTPEEETHAEGLEEGQKATEAGQEDTTKGNGESEEQIEEPTTDKAEGLKEGQEPGAGEEEKEEEEKPEEEQQAPGLKEGQAGNPGGGNKKRKKKEEDGSEAAFSLTSKRLKLHQETQDAITGLKEGHLSEADFWKAIQKSDMGSLWKKYEWARGKSPEAQEAWQQMGGPGVLAKKKQALLHFLRTGQSQEGGLQESQEASTSKKDKDLFEWVPWKQILDWYGKEEALSRVEAGSIPVRRDDRKFYEFLLIKKKTALSTEQKHRIATEQSIALKGAELVACKKALQAPRSQQEWEDLWSGRRPKNGFQVEDALSEESSSASEAEEEASSDEQNPAQQFLKGLKEGPKPKAIEGKPKKEEKLALKKEEEKRKKVEKAAAEMEKQKKKKDREEQKLKRNEAAEAKWEKKLDEATQVVEDDKDSKVKKMLGLVSKAVAEMKKACKKATDKSWGAAELQDLTRCRDELEDLSVDCHLQGIKDKLIEAGAALKASKKAMSTLA